MNLPATFRVGACLLAVFGSAWLPARQQVVPGQVPAQPRVRMPEAQRPAAAPGPEVSVPFRPGETLVYDIAWRLFTAGEARMHIERAPGPRGGWQASISAVSTGFVSKLYRVEDSITSIFESGAMCSQSALKVLNEGRRHREIRIQFDQERKVAAVRETDPTNNRLVRQAENAIPGCAFDVVSALYYVRTLPLEVGRTFQVPLNDGGRTLLITVEVQAKEDVKTGLGTFHAIRVEPRLPSGTLFPRSGRMQIWFTDDSQRVLVQLRARLFVGTISATLERAEHQ